MLKVGALIASQLLRGVGFLYFSTDREGKLQVVLGCLVPACLLAAASLMVFCFLACKTEIRKVGISPL